MKFLDEARIHVRAGAGGDGCLSFRREANLPRGGPDGGDGGRGGSIIAECVAGLNTLIDFRYRQHFRARAGRRGEGRQRTGAAGRDVLMEVPAGTEILTEDGVLIADLIEPGARAIIAQGGRGGLGNNRFKSSTNRAPRRTTPGEVGEERHVILRLKVIADAGLIGLPNAGKSTFLAAASRARPKIAEYPFTTLYPQLGVVATDREEFVLADIPGLIAGAHQGIGLGHRFLGHIERCHVLLHLVDAGAGDVTTQYQTVREELAAYGHGLDRKVEIVALNKIDTVAAPAREVLLAELRSATGREPLAFSAATGEGVPIALTALLAALRNQQVPAERATAAGVSGR